MSIDFSLSNVTRSGWFKRLSSPPIKGTRCTTEAFHCSTFGARMWFSRSTFLVHVVLSWNFHRSLQNSHGESANRDECETPMGVVGRCVRPSQCDIVDIFPKFPTFHCETESWFGICCPSTKVNLTTVATTSATSTAVTTAPAADSLIDSRAFPARCTSDMMRPNVRDLDNFITVDSSAFATRQLRLSMETPGPPLQAKDFSMARKMRMRPPPRYRGLNPMVTPGLFEGDIIGEWTQLQTELRPISSKSSISDPSKKAVRLWEGAVVPYVISAAFTRRQRATIARAFLEFHNLSCIRFVPRIKQKDYIFIVPRNGCFSHVGRQGGKQVLSLGPGCVFVGTIQHELMHVLGFWHEQSRVDRDRFVKIVYENILHNACHNFIRHDLRNLQPSYVPYDLGSIMHYGAYDFSKNGRPTILVRKRRGFAVDKNLGQRRGLSRIDVKKLNALYNCRR